jgi:hypothetical protein
MSEQPSGQQEILNRVYKGPTKTGDNVDGLVNLGYVWDEVTLQWVRASNGGGLVASAYDAVVYTNTSGTVDTYVYKTGGVSGTTVATVTITYTDSTKSQTSTIVRT